MFGFLQGFAYGLFLSCLPWFTVGMVRPDLALPTDPPWRWQVVLRYWFLFPFLAFLLWLTSLWGGFSPSLLGWLAGLAAIAVEIPLERRAALEREQREAGLAVLDPDQPPVEADDVVIALCTAKRRLLEARRPDLAIQADRLYTRYAHVVDVLRSKFNDGELTLERASGLVAEVCRGAVDNLCAMASQARGVAGVDVDFVRRRLQREGDRLAAGEREALRRRLELVEHTEGCLRELMARNEAALTALDDTAVAVASVETARPQASVATDQALRDLRRFIDKAEHYGRNSA
jgi:hypothetical protein